ncbi:hypothetical protein CRG98_048019 [Punica granatum]|uniref:Uncharacterized protein n=1 Tax=Punica granatum TaxID=22663 RepID=A0A2I0HJB7_PUNGR|nr:hypothetical protein CRG98_048019 [Punica granatum]
MGADLTGRRLRQGCSSATVPVIGGLQGAALGCMEERSRARVSDMGRESGQERDIRIRTRFSDSPRHPDPNQLVTTHEAPRGGLFALLEFR